jgi:hypothetical protein
MLRFSLQTEVEAGHAITQVLQRVASTSPPLQGKLQLAPKVSISRAVLFSDSALSSDSNAAIDTMEDRLQRNYMSFLCSQAVKVGYQMVAVASQVRHVPCGMFALKEY